MKITLGQTYSFCQQGKRSNQEDARYPNEDCPHGAIPFFVVCDGVGGCKKGEVASTTVCRAFAEALANTNWNKNFTNEDFRIALNSAYNALNDVANDDNADMATTLTFVAFHAGGCLIAHIGDSRIYHIRPDSGILYRSEDHSLVNALVHSGNLTPKEAENHPKSNVITRCIEVTRYGQERSNATVMRTENIQTGDYFFLCSDGVLESVSDDTLLDILSMPMTDKEKIDNIANLCQDSYDNNTAYLIPIVAVEKSETENEIDHIEQTNGYATNIFPKNQEQVLDITPDTIAKNKTFSLLKKLIGIG